MYYYSCFKYFFSPFLEGWQTSLLFFGFVCLIWWNVVTFCQPSTKREKIKAVPAAQLTAREDRRANSSGRVLAEELVGKIERGEGSTSGGGGHVCRGALMVNEILVIYKDVLRVWRWLSYKSFVLREYALPTCLTYIYPSKVNFLVQSTQWRYTLHGCVGGRKSGQTGRIVGEDPFSWDTIQLSITLIDLAVVRLHSCTFTNEGAWLRLFSTFCNHDAHCVPSQEPQVRRC